jgi:hypothetical protein
MPRRICDCGSATFFRVGRWCSPRPLRGLCSFDRHTAWQRSIYRAIVALFEPWEFQSVSITRPWAGRSVQKAPHRVCGSRENGVPAGTLIEAIRLGHSACCWDLRRANSPVALSCATTPMFKRNAMAVLMLTRHRPPDTERSSSPMRPISSKSFRLGLCPAGKCNRAIDGCASEPF